MNIIFTLAGQSKRFKEAGYQEPKFLLDIGPKKILESIVEMFSEDDKFYFVFNKEQIQNYPEINNIIKSSVKKFEIICIEAHQKGPAYSALQINTIDPSEPVIISYCDFLVEWDYNGFLSSIGDYEMAIPSFIGFHPSSFGETTYAYTLLNTENELIELREKQSFTSEKHNEFANAGIYYFKSFELFQMHANHLIEFDLKSNQEAYVSLIANKIVKSRGKVLITKINKFICLGTPFDYQMFTFWYEYFNVDNRQSNQNITTDINLIPMAGSGSRFKNEGYNSIKAMIQIENESMFLKTTRSFPKSKEWIFIFKDTPKLKYSNITDVIKETYDDNKIIILHNETSGQAATCLKAKNLLTPKKSLFIASCDYLSIYDQGKWEQMLKLNNDVDVFIWTYKPTDIIVKDFNAFAYCKVDIDSGIVLEIKEKEVISNNPRNDQMIIGSFWFRDSSDFINSAENAIKNNVTIKGEHYIGNSLNHLIQKGKKIKIFEINKWVSFGNPFELEVHNYWEDYFFQTKNTMR